MDEYEIKNKMIYIEDAIIDSRQLFFSKNQKIKDLKYFILEYQVVKDKVICDMDTKHRKFNEYKTYLRNGKATKKYAEFIEDYLTNRGANTLQKVESAVDQLKKQQALLEEQIYDVQQNMIALNNTYNSLSIELKIAK